MVAIALQARAAPPSGIPTRTEAGERSILRLRRANLDVATITVGDPLLRYRRLGLAGVGHLRSGQRLRDRPLADRPFLPPKRRPKLDHRWRGSPRVQCEARRADEHG